MTNPKPGDLAIFVRAEDVSEKCEDPACFGCHPDRLVEATLKLAGGKPYNPCHGSGTRKVTLEGYCKVTDIQFKGILNDIEHHHVYLGKEYFHIYRKLELKFKQVESACNDIAERVLVTIPDRYEGNLTLEEICGKVVEKIVAMLHDGTCPEAIRQQLHEVLK